MSNNLFKSYSVRRDAQDARIIDTNTIIEEKLERIRMVLPRVAEAVSQDDFYGGLTADNLDVLTQDTAEEGGDDREAVQPSNVIKAQSSQPPEPVYEGPSPQELVEQAQLEIAQMQEAARQEIETEKARALEEARQAGYEDGLTRGQQEAAGMKEALDREKKQLEENYEEKIEELEPEFVRVLTDIYEKVFEVDFAKDQDLVLALLRNSMKKIDGCKNFLVHVSKEDYPNVNEQKQTLISETSQEGTTVDVIEDISLRKNECMIETTGGIFDCGLGTQLSELKKKLVLLSYESNA